jgi:hypothetical protein
MTEPQLVESSTDRGPSITCFPSGNRFYLNDPSFNIEDISWHLGMMCRYGGAVRHFYSVAEHSVIVSLLMEELKLGDPLEGLLHDAHEAYLMDLPKPWKVAIAGWQATEHRLETAMRNQFALPEKMSAGCKQADLLALFIEGWYLKVDRGEGLYPQGHDNHEIRRIALKLVDNGWRVMNLYPPEATNAFSKRFKQLTGLV